MSGRHAGSGIRRGRFAGLRRLRDVAGAGLAAALVLGGASGCFSERPDVPEDDSGVAAEVTMTSGLAFDPDTVRIGSGETVRWRNTTSIIHTVTADPSLAADPGNVRLPEGAEAFHSGDLAPGEIYDRRFTTAGRYDYVCIPHELAGMIGVVIVE